MPPFQKMLLKHTKFKVIQQLSFSLMEFRLITEGQEQQMKCTDGLKKFHKQF